MYDFNALEQAVNKLQIVQNDNDIEERIRAAKIEQSTRITEAFSDICDFADKMKKVLPEDFTFTQEYSLYCSLTIGYSSGVLYWSSFDSAHTSSRIIFNKSNTKNMLNCTDQVRNLLIHFYNNWEAFLYDGCKEMGGKSFIDKCLDLVNKKAKEISDHNESQLRKYLL